MASLLLVIDQKFVSTPHRRIIIASLEYNEVARADINIMCTSEKHEDKDPQQQHINMSTSTS